MSDRLQRISDNAGRLMRGNVSLSVKEAVALAVTIENEVVTQEREAFATSSTPTARCQWCRYDPCVCPFAQNPRHCTCDTVAGDNHLCPIHGDAG